MIKEVGFCVKITSILVTHHLSTWTFPSLPMTTCFLNNKILYCFLSTLKCDIKV